VQVLRDGMGKFSTTTRKGDCEEVANPSTAYTRIRETVALLKKSRGTKP